MKSKAYIPLVVGLVVGVFAIKLTFDYVRKAKATTVAADGAVVRARTTIPMAAEITKDMVEVVQMPQALVPGDAFTRKEDVVGRVTSSIIPKDMPIVGGLLAPKGTLPGVEARIPAGYRAVAVKIDESSGVAFLVKPGSRVDVVAVMVQEGRNNETISKTILHDIEVAAVGQDLGHNTDKGAVTSKSVTLLVKPQDVPKLHLASQKGKILLAMRNQTDMSSRTTAETTEKMLLGTEGGRGGKVMNTLGALAAALMTPAPAAAKPAVSAERPKERAVRVFTGSLAGRVTREVVQLDATYALAAPDEARQADRGVSTERPKAWRAVDREPAAAGAAPTGE